MPNKYLKLQDEFGSLSHYFWHFFDGKPLINNVLTYKDVPSLTDLSKQIAKDLKKERVQIFRTDYHVLVFTSSWICE